MSNRNSQFSNQKSALEEYFNSLLSEEQDEPFKADDKTEEKSLEQFPEVTNSQVYLSESSPEPVVQTPKIKSTPPSIADMLATVAEATAEEPAKPLLDYAEPAPKIILPLPEVAPETEVQTEIVQEVIAEPKVDIKPAEVIEPIEIATPTVDVKPDPVIQPAVAEVATTPEWAESPFQCLLFKVGGLSLAVPLVKLNGVIPWSDNIVETPNQTDWYLGILMNHGHKVQVIDTAVMVLPPEHRSDLEDKPEERLSHILLVDDQNWGLACDSIGDVVWLQTSDVKWRTNKTKRPWLLGTAIDHMCAVMDTEAFASMLGNKS